MVCIQALEISRIYVCAMLKSVFVVKFTPEATLTMSLNTRRRLLFSQIIDKEEVGVCLYS